MVDIIVLVGNKVIIGVEGEGREILKEDEEIVEVEV